MLNYGFMYLPIKLCQLISAYHFQKQLLHFVEKRVQKKRYKIIKIKPFTYTKVFNTKLSKRIIKYNYTNII